MAVTTSKPAPYATPSAILDLIGRYRSRGLPSPVNADVLQRAGIAPTLIPRTLQSLHSLDLVDSKTGMPTPNFEALRLAPEPEFKKRLAAWLKGTYADVFTFVDPSKDDEGRMRDAFRSYQPVGQQERMVLLFQGLCGAAGLLPEKPAPAARQPPQRTPETARHRLTFAASAAKASHKLAHKLRETRQNLDGGMPLGLPPAVAGLLASLPADGQGWTNDRRAKFLTTFETVLDFCIPIVAKEAVQDDEAA